ncbi:MAG: ferrous iron transport protein A [Sulfobacillus acidophilus]|uniref:Ferrous iron transport protein A n=1 Tax=Sulfobacillus acidophilus TaxID=53633 RepID=A0A2T2WJ06_9FIRM|nr:MAG: ferrous iron transport protein A [Sulfobacillus acidophilus]
MTLADVRVGQKVRVVAIEHTSQAAEVIRLGIIPGLDLAVVTKVRSGPVVVQNGVSEVAIGYRLARRIVVQRVE